MNMQEFGSLDELFAAIGGSLGQKAREWSERQWQEALNRATRGIAHEILKSCELPALVSMSAPSDGVASFIEMESDEAWWHITITATRKAPKTAPEPVSKPFATRPKSDVPEGKTEADRCAFCGRFHSDPVPSAVKVPDAASEPDDASAYRDREPVEKAEPVKPWPAWGEPV